SPRWLVLRHGDARIVGDVTPEASQEVRASLGLLGGSNAVQASPYRSKLEAHYAALLTMQQRAGEVVRWRYEAIRLTLAPRTTLTVDFVLTLPDGRIVFDETKGFRRDDAMAKLKIAAALYPEWTFRLVTRERDQ